MDLTSYFLDPYQEIKEETNRLPHWHQTGARLYFLTFRLADSTPRKVMDEIKEDRERWNRTHPQPWSATISAEYHQRFVKPQFQWMDTCIGSCLLRIAELRAILEDVLGFFEGVRHEHVSWVIMPNHAHLLTVLYEDWPPKRIIGSWKREVRE